MKTPTVEEARDHAIWAYAGDRYVKVDALIATVRSSESAKMLALAEKIVHEASANECGHNTHFTLGLSKGQKLTAERFLQLAKEHP